MERLRPSGDEEVARFDAILEGIAAQEDPRITALLAEVVAGIHRLHAGALERLVEILAEEPETFGRVLEDPLVANLFHLYDLILVDEARRAREALAAIRPELREHGGDARLVEMDDGVAVLHLEGASTAIEELRRRIDQALAAAVPGYRGFRAPEDAEPASPAEPRAADVSFVSLGKLRKLAAKARERQGGAGEEASAPPSDWLPVEGAGDLAEGQMLGRLVAGAPVLLVRLDGELHAYRNACPGSLLPLHLGHLEDHTLVCRWHGCRFALPAGEEEGEGTRSLQRLPLEASEGKVRVEVPT